ncbi:hypothetical protein FKM82_018225 [Ascaphus truei]
MTPRPPASSQLRRAASLSISCTFLGARSDRVMLLARNILFPGLPIFFWLGSSATGQFGIIVLPYSMPTSKVPITPLSPLALSVCLSQFVGFFCSK